MIEPVWDFESYVCVFKEVLPNVSAQLFFVTEGHAVMVFPCHIFQVIQVVHIGRGHVIRMYDTADFAKSVEFIALVVHALRGAVFPHRDALNVITAEDTSDGSRILTDFYGFSPFNAFIASIISSPRFFVSLRRVLNWWWPIKWGIALGHTISRRMKIRFTLSMPKASIVEERAMTSRLENFGEGSSLQTFPLSFTEFLANYSVISRILLNFVTKLCIAMILVITFLIAILLKINDIRNFSL